jgi:hypothetical protein
MFVRWKTFRRTRRLLYARGRDGDTRVAAILGVNVRADGRRGYRHLAYLGAYYEGGNIFDHADFWDTVGRKLESLCPPQACPGLIKIPDRMGTSSHQLRIVSC